LSPTAEDVTLIDGSQALIDGSQLTTEDVTLIGGSQVRCPSGYSLDATDGFVGPAGFPSEDVRPKPET